MLENLSSTILVKKCPCGLVFETYTKDQVYHSGTCKQRCNMGKKRAKDSHGSFVKNER